MATAEVIPRADVPIFKAQNLEQKMEFKGSLNSFKLSFDPIALSAKYKHEKEKRISAGGGLAQYQQADGDLGKYLLVPWTKPILRQPLNEATEVTIIRGGYGAQCVAAHLLEH